MTYPATISTQSERRVRSPGTRHPAPGTSRVRWHPDLRVGIPCGVTHRRVATLYAPFLHRVGRVPSRTPPGKCVGGGEKGEEERREGREEEERGRRKKRGGGDVLTLLPPEAYYTARPTRGCTLPLRLALSLRRRPCSLRGKPACVAPGCASPHGLHRGRSGHCVEQPAIPPIEPDPQPQASHAANVPARHQPRVTTLRYSPTTVRSRWSVKLTLSAPGLRTVFLSLSQQTSQPFYIPSGSLSLDIPRANGECIGAIFRKKSTVHAKGSLAHAPYPALTSAVGPACSLAVTLFP